MTHRLQHIARLLAATAMALPLAVQAAEDAPPLYLETPAGQKPRVVITADPELDDSNSLVRYLLYSNDVRTEGLIYASSQFHWTGDGRGTTLSVPGREYTRFGLDLCPCTSWRWDQGERFIDDAVAAYAQAWPNLIAHDADYPSPVALKSVIRWGNVQFDGEMERDTPGSDLIRALLLDEEEAPIYLHAWGGHSTIARALKSIEEEFAGTPQWAAIRAKVIRKAIIHPSADQDDTYGRYIRPNWPEIRYRQVTGGVPLSYNAQGVVSEADAAFFTADWTRDNVSSRGPLGAFYRVWGDGRHMVAGDIFDYFGEAGKTAEQLRAEGYIVWTPPRGTGEFLGEGDTPTFLNLIDNGLAGYRTDSFGGWGGVESARYVPGFASSGEGSPDAVAADPQARGARSRAPTHPFLAAAQNDLAGRFRWATTPDYAGANHNPRVELTGTPLRSARPGETLVLAATVSDPDGDATQLRWWRHDAADSFAGDVPLTPRDNRVTLSIPRDAQPGDTIHLVAEARDDGTPPLTHYARVVITVAP
ncbi:nucleoside hydrolase-like domain-containing protein [Croceibacterium xixiisoli]|nr:nucleoside hydrolase-like domain-containing protein [Croceibacterium xixiisoli]